MAQQIGRTDHQREGLRARPCLLPKIEKANLLASNDAVGSSGPLEGLRLVHKAYLEPLDRTAQGLGFGQVKTS